MGIFGSGSTCKPTLVRKNQNELCNLGNYLVNGTADTTIMIANTTWGGMFETTVTNTDDQTGHVFLNDGFFTPLINTKLMFEARCTFDVVTTAFAIGFADGWATANSGVLATTGAIADSDFIGFHHLQSSAFWRAEQANESVRVASGATTTVATAATFYKLRMNAEIQTNGIHARFYVDENLIYTIGFGSSVNPVTITGWNALNFGWATGTTTTTAAVGTVQPLRLEYATLGT